MNVGKVLLGGGEDYLPFALSKLRYVASLGQFPVSRTIAVDDGATILIEAWDEDNGRVTIRGGVVGMRFGNEGMTGLRKPVAGKKGFFVEWLYPAQYGTVFSLLAPTGRTLREWRDGQFIFSALVNETRMEVGRTVCQAAAYASFNQRYGLEISTACTCSKVPGVIPVYVDNDPAGLVASYDVAWMEKTGGKWGIQRHKAADPDTYQESKTYYPLEWDLTYLYGDEVVIDEQLPAPENSFQELHDSVNSWARFTYEYLGPGPTQNGAGTSRYSQKVTWGSTHTGLASKSVTSTSPIVVATAADVYAIYISTHDESSVSNIQKDAPSASAIQTTWWTTEGNWSRELRLKSFGGKTDIVIASGGCRTRGEDSSNQKSTHHSQSASGATYYYSGVLAPEANGKTCYLYVTETIASYGYYAGDYGTMSLTLYEIGEEITSTLLFSTKQMNGSPTIEVTFSIDPSYSLEFLNRYFFGATMTGFTHNGVSICCATGRGTALIMTNKKATGSAEAVHTIMAVESINGGAYLAGGKLYDAASFNGGIAAYSTSKAEEGYPMLAKLLPPLESAEYGMVVNPSIKN